MHYHFLDPYTERASLVHQLDSRVKLALVVAFVLTAALTPVGAWPVYVLLLALAFSAELLSGLGIGYYLKRALLALPFVLAALPVLFTSQGEALAHLPLNLTISAPGVERFASVALKSWISVQAAVLLATTTSFPQILVAMRALRVPRLLVAIIGLMWRYLFVMADEALRLMRAREARSGHVKSATTSSTTPAAAVRPGGTLLWRAKVTGGMAGNLFLRSLERSDRIYMAMLARGYDGEMRSLPLPKVGGGSRLALALGLLLLAALLALGYAL